MSLRSASDRFDGVKWYCNDCKVEISICQDSFFTHSYLLITKLLEILYWWTLDCNFENVSNEIEVLEKSLVDFFPTRSLLCVDWHSFWSSGWNRSSMWSSAHCGNRRVPIFSSQVPQRTVTRELLGFRWRWAWNWTLLPADCRSPRWSYASSYYSTMNPTSYNHC